MPLAQTLRADLLSSVTRVPGPCGLMQLRPTWGLASEPAVAAACRGCPLLCFWCPLHAWPLDTGSCVPTLGCGPAMWRGRHRRAQRERKGVARPPGHPPLLWGASRSPLGMQLTAADAQHLRAMGQTGHHICSFCASLGPGATEGRVCPQALHQATGKSCPAAGALGC